MMAVSISVLIGLVGMFSYGVSDFLLKRPSEEIGEIRTMFYIYLLGSVLVLPIFFFFLKNGLPKLNLVDYGLMISLVFFDVFGFVNFLIGIRKGHLSLITPIVSSFAVVTVILSIIFLKETLSITQVIAIAVIIFGIIFTSTDLRRLSNLKTIKGVSNAILAFFFWGLLVFFSDITINRLVSTNGILFGIITLYLYTSVISVVLVLVMALFNREQNLKIPNKNQVLRLIILVLIFKVGWGMLNYGFVVGKISIIAPVASLSPAVTVILAQIFYKEKLVTNQKLGILTILFGLVLISL
jgi:transporter family protein